MKTVTIEGKEYEVPDNANYVAMDDDGRWWWYENMPTNRRGEWCADGWVGIITYSVPWIKTLRKI